MHYTATRYPSAIGGFRLPRRRMDVVVYVIMGRYEVAFAGRIIAGS
jgi:hypothetical protein